MKVGHKYNDLLLRFTEYSIQGIPQQERRIVVQKGKDESPPFYGIWYIYDVTKDLITTIGWSRAQWVAEKKARGYIRNLGAKAAEA